MEFDSLSTQNRIQDAIYSLVMQRSLDQITVNDILKEAHVARPTFYRYFSDKYAAANSLYDRHIEALRDTFLHNKDTKELLCSFYQVFYNHKEYYTSLLSDIQSQNSFFNYWEKLNYEQTYSVINHKLINDEVRLAVVQFIHGSMDVSWELIKGSFQLTPEEAAACVIKNMPPLLRELMQVTD